MYVQDQKSNRIKFLLSVLVSLCHPRKEVWSIPGFTGWQVISQIFAFVLFLVGRADLHVVEVGDVPEFDVVVVGGRCDVGAGVADVHPLHGDGVLANDAKVFVGEEVGGPQDAVLPGHDHNVLGDGDHAGDGLLGPGVLVAM